MIKPMISVRAALDQIANIVNGPLDDELARHKIKEILEDFDIAETPNAQQSSERSGGN